MDEQESAEDQNRPKRDSYFERTTGRAHNLWTACQTQAWSMFLFLIAGALFAFSHHMFYSRLHGTEADSQSLMLRYGTILAFCAKASLYTAVTIAFRQRAWMVVRHKMVRLGLVDSIFTAAEDLAALLDWKAIRKAKMAMLLAAYVWATPLIVVLTSETLSVVSGMKQEESFCPSARTLNFTHEEFADWREEASGQAGGLGAMSFNVWNTTSFELNSLEDKNPNKFDYWARPISWIGRLVRRAVSLRQAAVLENAGKVICTDSWNCSYVVEFTGPGYKCETVASGVGSEGRLGDLEPPMKVSDIMPTTNISYLAMTTEGEYHLPQINYTGDHGLPLSKPPYPKNLGAFRTEPIIWIGYAEVNDTDVRQPEDKSSPGWYNAYTPVIVGCEHYEVEYTVEFNYTNGFQSYDVKDRKYNGKVIDTKFVRNKTNYDGTLDNTTSIPESNFVFPKEVRKYRKTAAYHALGLEFRKFLKGQITVLPNEWSNTEIYGTPLITRLNTVPVKDLGNAIRKLYEDILVSLLSEPQFLAVSWAYNGMPSGHAPGGPETNYSCIRRRPAAFFSYNKMQAAQLCTVYALSIAMALVGALLGLEAAREEGTMRDMKPSSIIAATRTPSLYGAQSTVAEQGVKGLRVGFGWVQEHSGGSIRGFGVEGDVAQGHFRSQKKAFWKNWFRRPERRNVEVGLEEVRDERRGE